MATENWPDTKKCSGLLLNTGKKKIWSAGRSEARVAESS